MVGLRLSIFSICLCTSFSFKYFGDLTYSSSPRGGHSHLPQAARVGSGKPPRHRGALIRGIMRTTAWALPALPGTPHPRPTAAGFCHRRSCHRRWDRRGWWECFSWLVSVFSGSPPFSSPSSGRLTQFRNTWSTGHTHW